MILDNTGGHLVTSLGINLALNKKNAEIMAEENRLQKLLGKAFKSQDSLIMKMLHNMSMSEVVIHYMVVRSQYIGTDFNIGGGYWCSKPQQIPLLVK